MSPDVFACSHGGMLCGICGSISVDIRVAEGIAAPFDINDARCCISGIATAVARGQASQAPHQLKRAGPDVEEACRV